MANQSTQPLLGSADSAEISDEETPAITVPSSDTAPQYSPSVSHDEKEEEEEKWEGLELHEKPGSSDKDNEASPISGRQKAFLPVASSIHSAERDNDRGNELEGDSEEEWSGFDEEGMGGGGGWGSAWTTESDFRTDSVASSHSQGDINEATPITTPTGSGSGQLKLKTSKKMSEEHKAVSESPVAGGKSASARVTSPRTGPTLNTSTATEVGKKMKGRLKKEDIERLEQQALVAAAEPDFFADMTPAIGGKGGPLAQLGAEVGAESTVFSSSALQYHPSEEVS